MQSLILAVLILVQHPGSFLFANSDNLVKNEWRIYDVNGDGKFDISDIDEFLDRGGIGFINDLNNDGKKDLSDAFALYVKLSILDRNCDEAVDDSDFTPVAPIKLPEPNAAEVWSLVARIVTQAAIKLPPDIENQVFRAQPVDRVLTPFEKAYIFEVTGMSAILQLNLEGAQWAYGRAYQTNTRSATALGSLGFAIAVDKRHEEALMLLAYARELFRESGATSTCIGWIFARHGQNQEALTYYREAVAFAPKIAQYHMNLGIAYMRVGNREKACEEFRIASELDPGNFYALLFKHTVSEERSSQATALDLKRLIEEDALRIRELKESGASDDELPAPWNECSPCEKARRVPELLETRDSRKFSQTAQLFADDLQKKANQVAEAHNPKLKSVKEDMENWVAAFKWGLTVGKALKYDAEKKLGNQWASMCNERGLEIISFSSYFLECAKEQAVIESKIQSDYEHELTKDLPVSEANRAVERAENYQIALEEAINECFRDPMLMATALLHVENTPISLPTSSIESVFAEYFPLAVAGLCIEIPGYCDGDPDISGFDPSGLDNTFSLNLWVASFEYNSNTGAWELRILPGTGIILGATWSPESSFGFQAGVNLGLNLVVAGFNIEGYFEVNKNGMSLNGEAEAFLKMGVLEAGLETSGSVPVTPSQATTGEPLPDFVRD